MIPFYRCIVVVLILPLLTAGRASAGDDFQYWQQLSLNAYKSETLELMLFTDFRFMQNAEKLGLYFISPRAVYHSSKNLDLALNYTYLQSRPVSSSAVDDSYNGQHRIEPEINPKWSVTDWLKVHMRNRVEFRWIENKGWDNTRYRQRWMLTCPIKSKSALSSVYLNSELIYDAHRRAVVENRSVPMGLSFRINDKSDLKLYWMIQSQKGAHDWLSNQIIGSLFSVSF